MDKRKGIIFAIVAAVLLLCVVGVILLTAPSGNGSDAPETTGGTTPSANPEDPSVSTDPTVPAQSEDPVVPMDPTAPTQSGEQTVPTHPGSSAVPTDPTIPTQPVKPTIPTEAGDPSAPTDPAVPTQPVKPTVPTQPEDPTDPVGPDLPVVAPGVSPETTVPAQPSDPVAPSEPTGTEVPTEDPDPLQKVEIAVTREDGSLAQGAAVIATHDSGRQEYATTDENGVAVLYLPEGKHSLRLLHDGQHGNLEVEVAGEPIEKSVQLKDDRVLYILLAASGGYKGDPNELTDFSTIEDAIKAQYPDAVYLTSEDRYDVEFRDGDALLSVEIFIENYTSGDQYFASGVFVDFRTYQECITVWDMDDAGKEIDTEFIDGNMCSIQVRNDYDYDYKNSVSVITESYYAVQKDWHFSKHSGWADSWSYGYQTESVLSTSKDQRTKAPGAGMKTETFLSGSNAPRLNDYLAYVQQVFPYVDLWMSKTWNDGIEELVTAQ